MGKEAESLCSIGEKLPVSGTLYVKDAGGNFEVEEKSHLLEEGPLTELWVLNKTTEHKATLDGSASLSPAGEHLGREWSGLGG
jgi:hypothetical protein